MSDPVAAADAARDALIDAAATLGALLADVPDRLHGAFSRAPDCKAEFFRMATTSMARKLDRTRAVLAQDLADLAHACRRPKARTRPGRAPRETSLAATNGR